jgi:hypothetical protein
MARSAQSTKRCPHQELTLRDSHYQRIHATHVRLVGCLIAFVSSSASPQRPVSDSSLQQLAIGILEPRESERDSSTARSIRGITLGIEEAQRTARLFGWEVVALRAPDSLDTADAMRFLATQGVTAMVGNLTASLQLRSGLRSVPLMMDVGARHNAPDNDCGQREFRLLPLLDSAHWAAHDQQKPWELYAGLVAWDPALERFGAAQLNDRYRKRFGSEMDENAWAGWMSIKILVDAALRKGTKDPCALERFFVSTEAHFDGHKGVPLFFDPRTRDLVQPLFARRAAGEPEAVAIGLAPDTHVKQHRTRVSPCPVACGSSQ